MKNEKLYAISIGGEVVEPGASNNLPEINIADDGELDNSTLKTSDAFNFKINISEKTMKALCDWMEKVGKMLAAAVTVANDLCKDIMAEIQKGVQEATLTTSELAAMFEELEKLAEMAPDPARLVERQKIIQKTKRYSTKVEAAKRIKTLAKCYMGAARYLKHAKNCKKLPRSDMTFPPLWPVVRAQNSTGPAPTGA